MIFTKSTEMKITLAPEQEEMLSTKDTIKEMIRENPDTVLAFDIYQADELIGFVLVHRFEDRKYFLWEFAIDIRHQNQHKGTQALVEFIEFMKKNYDAIEFTTTYIYGNDHAKHVYEKVGFIETDVVDEPDCHEVNMAYYVQEPEPEIVALPKEQWKDTIVPLVTRSDSYYDFSIDPFDYDGCTIRIERKKAEKEIVHTPEEYDFPDSLYADYRDKAEAYGVVSDDGELLACIEVCVEEWSNRMIVSELWVSEGLRSRHVGKRLMDKAKEIAAAQGRRAIMLETQSCNTKAIGFYLHQGFEIIGFDTCCYSNNDIARREVRINLGYFFR